MIIKEIPLNQIKPGRYQPRQDFDHEKLLDLATSIQDEGLLYPLLVFLDQDNKYELIGGERRWRASCALVLANLGAFDGGLADAIRITATAGWPEQISNGHYPHFCTYRILVSEQEPTITPEQQRVRAVADNLQRADLTPFEEAQAIYDLKTQLNLSIRQVAAKVGKSKSWVEDRLKLMKLDPAAAQAVAAAQTDETTPTLDMTVIREVARRLPEPLQKPVLDVLQARAGKFTTDELKKLVSNLAAFTNPEKWSVSSDLEQPTHPRVFNRGRLMIHLLNTLPPETLIKRALMLDDQNRYQNYLGKSASKILDNDWDFTRVSWAIAFGNKDRSYHQGTWDEIAPAQGWTCDRCIKQKLVGAIEHRVREFDIFNAPCRRFSESSAITCSQFVAAGDGADIPVITLPDSLTRAIPESDQPMIKTTLLGGGSYVETWTDYHHLYNQARLQLAEQETREKAEQKTAHLIPLREYWNAQVTTPHGLDIHDFQAHACHKCKFYELANKEQYGAPCKFANGSLQRHGKPAAPTLGVLVDDNGRPVPRCSKFRYADMPQITAYPDSFTAASDLAKEIIMRWYRSLTAVPRHSFDDKLIFGVLAWLPEGEPSKKKSWELWAEFTDAETLALLNIGVSEAAALNNRSFSNEPHSLLEPNGRTTRWQPMSWRNFIGQEKHWNWGDWPTPWTVRPADTK